MKQESIEAGRMVVAGLDFGRRRIGMAVADGESHVVYPLGTIERRSLEHDLEAICARLAQRGVGRIVVGLPLNMDGSVGPAARAARAFADRLAAASGLPVEMFDERLTSFEAEERLRGATGSRAKRKRAVDAVAAAVILEGWLESPASRKSNPG